MPVSRMVVLPERSFFCPPSDHDNESTCQKPWELFGGRTEHVRSALLSDICGMELTCQRRCTSGRWRSHRDQCILQKHRCEDRATNEGLHACCVPKE